jgi:hypothetical protein
MLEAPTSSYVSEMFNLNETLSDTGKTCLALSKVGTWEEMLEWRETFLRWLDDANLCGNYCIRLTAQSRTWTLSFYFDDVKDALVFKTRWG